MNKQAQIKKRAKIVLWITLACVCYVGIEMTMDVFVYRQAYRYGNTLWTYLHFRQLNCSNNKTFEDYANGNTTRKTNIAFLKVHKAGSSSMQNLLFRFGLRHKLNIFLPESGHYLNNESQIIPLKPCEHYNIFALHTVYQKELFERLIPDDSVNIGIVREPVNRLISAAYYYRDVMKIKYLGRIPPENFIHNLVNFPEKYDKDFFSHTRNTMGHDFGFPEGIKRTNTVKIRKYLDELNSQFLLVLIMEKFDESLILMKRLLNWSFIDIIYMKKYSHEHNRVGLNESEKTKFRATSFLDFEIYEYFLNVFDMKLKQMNDEFYDEVSFFKTVVDRVSEFCVGKQDTVIKLLIQQSKWESEFEILATDCKLMQTESLKFVDKIRKQQLESV